MAFILKKDFLFLAKINGSCFSLRNISLDLKTEQIYFLNNQFPVDFLVGLFTVIP